MKDTLRFLCFSRHISMNLKEGDRIEKSDEVAPSTERFIEEN